MLELTQAVGLEDGQIVERFDSYSNTSALEKLSKDLRPRGVNFFARKAGRSVHRKTVEIRA